MKDFIKHLTIRRVKLIVKEVDLVKVLEIIDSNRFLNNVTVGKCDCENNYWVIDLVTSAAIWEPIRNEIVNRCVDKELSEVKIWKRCYEKLRYGD